MFPKKRNRAACAASKVKEGVGCGVKIFKFSKKHRSANVLQTLGKQMVSIDFCVALVCVRLHDFLSRLCAFAS